MIAEREANERSRIFLFFIARELKRIFKIIANLFEKLCEGGNALHEQIIIDNTDMYIEIHKCNILMLHTEN